MKVYESGTNILARWANVLNYWRWPDDMPGKPEGFDDLQDGSDEKIAIIRPLTQAIERLIGKKAILRWHHLYNLKRTPKQFEAWWAENSDLLESAASGGGEAK